MKNPLSRRIFAYVLICSFFIITTIVLLFAFGYRFDWNRGIFVYTGSITIKPNPFDIKIKLNGEEKNYTSNFLNDYYEITGLFPGIYDIEVSASEFNSWSKKISVHSGKSTELWNVLLVRENYERENFKSPEIKNFFPAPKEFTFAYVSEKDNNLETGVIDTEKKEILNKLNLENVKFTDNKFENIEWSPDTSALIVPVIRQIEISEIVETENEEKIESPIMNKKDYLIFNLKTNDYFYLSEKLSETDFSSILLTMADSNFNSKFSSVRWSPKEENSLYFIFDGELYFASLNLKEKNILNPLAIYPASFQLGEDVTDFSNKGNNSVLAYDFADDGIYIFNGTGSVLYNRDFEVEELKELTKFQIENNLAEFRLNAYDNERIVLLNNENGDFYLYNKIEEKVYSKKLSSGIIDAHFSDDGKKLVYYSASDIFMYFTRIWDDQPVREENENKSVTRLSKKIGNVHFTKDYEHIVFSSGNEIKIIGIEKTNPQTITYLKTEKTKIISDHRNDILYFLDETENKNDNLFQINFPEKLPLFDFVK